MKGFDVLKERGFFYQTTDEDALRRELNGSGVCFYVGFDPTGSSLHIGHLLPVMAMRWLQQAGHKPLALVGGATAMVGDPSGKSEARPILTVAEVDANANAIRNQLSRFLNFDEGQAELVNNADWLRPVKYIDFLRDVGRHFSINRMLAAESVKMRLTGDSGLSFLEFNYMLLQAYDFYILNREKQCTMQLGGQDQWGNIVAGIDLTRRMAGKEVLGATFPLLLKSDGEKFGKTAGGAVWLDADRTSPFDYYQFWRNVADADVGRLMGFFTTLPMDEVNTLAALPAPAINRAKEILAYEATALAHGHEHATKAYLAAGAEFGFAPDAGIYTSSAITSVNKATLDADLPSFALNEKELEQGIGILSLFSACGLTSSNADARRLIKGGGAYLNDEKLTDERLLITREMLENDGFILRSGKKKVCRIILG